MMKSIFIFVIGALSGVLGAYLLFSMRPPEPVASVAIVTQPAPPPQEAVVAPPSPPSAGVIAPAAPPYELVPPGAAPAPIPVPALIPVPAVTAAPPAPPSPAAASPQAVAPAAAAPTAVSVDKARVGSLLMPVAGINARQLSDSFNQVRGAERHEAIDIMATRGTPVFAVDDGRIAKLFNSKPGGLTIYHFDTAEKIAYYYAHLDRYVAGLADGQRVKRGDLIGYVGSTGNANPTAPHLHFAIFELGPEKRWWQGTAINPYPLLIAPDSK